MKVLCVTNMLPSDATPCAGTFIEQQIEGLRRINIGIEVLLIDRASHGPLEYVRAGTLVRRAAEQSHCDLVHIMYGGMLADLATRVLGAIPSVVSFCGVDLLGANYGSRMFQLRTRLGVWASHRAARRADAIIVKSRNLERGLPDRVEPHRVFLVPNGISLERFRPMDQRDCQASLGWDPELFHILFSTANPTNLKKRYSLAAAAVQLLERRGRRAVLHGMSNIPHPEVPLWINAADVLLFTSRSDEGSPNIVKESLACNLPVVSVDVGDVAERLMGIDGCYLAEATPADLADKLELVATGQRARTARARMEELSIERVAERLRSIYQRVLDRDLDRAR